MAYIADCPKPVERQPARGGRSTEGTAAPASSRLATELHFGEGASVGKVTMSAEVLLSFETTIAAPDGGRYRAAACGREAEDGRWEGWIEFAPIDGGDVLRSARETVQPNRTDLVYWATGLSTV